MKKHVKIIAAPMLAAVLALSTPSAGAYAAGNLAQYRKAAKAIEEEYGLDAVDSSKLTYGKITSRKYTVIVERCIGKVRNKKKDGRILNAADGSGDYISYRSVDCEKGDIVVSYFLWNPENNIEDDIIARWDFVLE